MTILEYECKKIHTDSREATPFASKKWPFKRGGLSSGVEINTLMFRFTWSSDLSRGGGLSSGWPPKYIYIQISPLFVITIIWKHSIILK